MFVHYKEEGVLGKYISLKDLLKQEERGKLLLELSHMIDEPVDIVKITFLPILDAVTSESAVFYPGLIVVLEGRRLYIKNPETNTRHVLPPNMTIHNIGGCMLEQTWRTREERTQIAIDVLWSLCLLGNIDSSK